MFNFKTIQKIIKANTWNIGRYGCLACAGIAKANANLGDDIGSGLKGTGKAADSLSSMNPNKINFMQSSIKNTTGNYTNKVKIR